VSVCVDTSVGTGSERYGMPQYTMGCSHIQWDFCCCFFLIRDQSSSM